MYKNFEAYYDSHQKGYWVKNERSEWIELTERSFERRLRELGCSGTRTHGMASELDKAVCQYQRKHDVAYAGPLAGCMQGMREISGQRILVTCSPKLIQPKAGEWPVFRQFLDNLLGPVQLPYLHGWLKCAVEAVRSGSYRPGQALAIAGPADCGKSLLQGLITELLGGRSAKCFRYMDGRTDFNSELFGAEHLMVEDEAASTDIRRRQAFGAHIKAFTVNPVQSCHAKGRPAISLSPCWRLSLTVNEEPENLLVFPPLEESVEAKIMLLKAFKARMPMPTETMEQFKAFREKLVSELPAFLHFLAEWKIPEELRSARFGVKHYHHPQLLSAINELAPEEQLLTLMEAYLPYGKDGVWEGEAGDLGVLLTDTLSGYDATAAKRLLSWPNAAGKYLGRLAHRYPTRIQSCRTATKRGWRITKGACDGSDTGVSGCPSSTEGPSMAAKPEVVTA